MTESDKQDMPEMAPEGGEPANGNAESRSSAEDGTRALEEECDGAIEELLARIEHLERRCAALEKSLGDHSSTYEHSLRRAEQQQPPRERHWYLRKFGE